jgi:hypothetical protein
MRIIAEWIIHEITLTINEGKLWEMKENLSHKKVQFVENEKNKNSKKNLCLKKKFLKSKNSRNFFLFDWEKLWAHIVGSFIKRFHADKKEKQIK